MSVHTVSLCSNVSGGQPPDDLCVATGLSMVLPLIFQDSSYCIITNFQHANQKLKTQYTKLGTDPFSLCLEKSRKVEVKHNDLVKNDIDCAPPQQQTSIEILLMTNQPFHIISILPSSIKHILLPNSIEFGMIYLIQGSEVVK